MLHRQMRRVCTALLVVVLGGAFAAALADSQYLYDDLGRLILAVNSDGSAVVYEHDANGNMTAAHHWAGAAPILVSFSPTFGRVGTQVTIQGTGFSADPGENLVTIGGAAAVVDSATSSQLIVTVPTAAVTGPIAVTVDSTVGISTQSYVVLRPTITGFSPTLVNPGNAVTLTGTNLNLVPGSTSIAAGSTGVTITSLSNTQAVFNAPSPGANAVTVNTSYGQATSTAILTVIPSSINAANVVARSQIELGGGSGAITIAQASKFGLFEFDAAANQLLSLQISTLTTTPSGASVSYQVISPTGAAILSGSISNTSKSIHLPKLPATGRYVVSFASGSSTSVQVTAVLDANATLVADLPTTASFAIGGQSKRFVANATAGQSGSVYLSSFAMTPAGTAVGMKVFNPSGGQIVDISGTTTATADVNGMLAGSYTILLTPNSAATGSVQLSLVPGVTATLPTDGTSQSLTTVPGQSGYFTFGATAGDDLGLGITGISISSTHPNHRVNVYVYRPNGSQLASVICNPNTTTACALSLLNVPDTGTYSVRVSPAYNYYSMNFTLTLSHDVTGTLTLGTPLNVTSDVPGRQALLSFAATAGQAVSLNIDSFAMSGAYVDISLYNPNGTLRTSFGGASGTTADINDLVAGTYTVLVAPRNAASGSLQVTMAAGLVGVLPANGTSQSFSSNVVGQGGYFTFAANAGDDLALALSGITFSSTYYAYAYITRPNGSTLSTPTCTQTTGACSASLLDLPDTGTYKVRVSPGGFSPVYSTMSFAITLSQDVTGTLTLNTPLGVTFDVPGRQAALSFTATAGQAVSLNIDSLAVSGVYVEVSLYNPNGTLRTSFSGAWSMTADINDLVAGTYTVLVAPRNAATGSLQVTMAGGLVGVLPANGTSQSFSSNVPGQGAYLTFAANAGDDLALALTGITFSSTYYAYAYITRPNGSTLSTPTCTQTTGACSTSLRNLPDTGTYRIRVSPGGFSPVYSTMSFTITLSQDVTGTLTLGTPLNVTLDVPGRQALLTFTATSGQSLALIMSSVATTPAGTYVDMDVFNPSGTQIVDSGGSSGATSNLSSLAAGTYEVLIAPRDAATGTLQVKIQ